MPLYEYSCSRCGELFEVMQKFSDPPLTQHQSCGGPVERLLSPPALQFKGSGWYVTDYARNSGNASNGPNGKPEDKPGKADAKSDANKPAPAADK